MERQDTPAEDLAGAGRERGGKREGSLRRFRGEHDPRGFLRDLDSIRRRRGIPGPDEALRRLVERTRWERARQPPAPGTARTDAWKVRPVDPRGLVSGAGGSLPRPARRTAGSAPRARRAPPREPPGAATAFRTGHARPHSGRGPGSRRRRTRSIPGDSNRHRALRRDENPRGSPSPCASAPPPSSLRSDSETISRFLPRSAHGKHPCPPVRGSRRIPTAKENLFQPLPAAEGAHVIRRRAPA